MLTSTILSAAAALLVAADQSQQVLQGKHDSDKSLSWEDCGTLNDHKLECSRIEVPADHFHHALDQTFSLPLIRMIGKNATANGNKTILLNPGGPGGSGISHLRRRGPSLNTIIGENFNLLSFDPRGVMDSKPQAICFTDPKKRIEQFERNPWSLEFEAGDMWAGAKNRAKACNETMGELGAYINTPQTAADMNSILDAIGQDFIYYYGFSYGTTLGQTYAQMFPERVGRLIIDGVSNLDEWYSSFGQSEELDSTDDVFFGFIEECYKAKENCPLNSLDGEKFRSSHDLQTYVMGFLKNLEDEPIPVYINNTDFGTITRRSLVTNAIFSHLYTPVRWPGLAEDLKELFNGNPVPVYLKYSDSWIAGILFDDSNPLITMNDAWKTGSSAPLHDVKSIKEFLQSQPTWSKLYSRYVGSEIFDREAWILPTTHNFHPQYHPEFPRFKTANPILVLSTTYDPICPLLSAQKAHDSFENSGFLEQKSYGHCTSSFPSLCTAKHIREYFADGILPAPGASCEVNAEYFPAPDKDSVTHHKEMQDDDVELLQALQSLAETQEPGRRVW